MAKGLFSSLKGIDAFGKTMEDVKVRTRTGAFLTLVAASIILTFTGIEFFDYRRTYTDTSVMVDKSRGEKLTVIVNVTFPRVPCYLLSLDVTDISGDVQREVTHNIYKTRLNDHGLPVLPAQRAELRNEVDIMHEHDTAKVSGGYCGSCFGGTPPESGCCNTCEEVREAYVTRGWSFSNPDSIEQCINEGWSEKLREQSNEGCNLAGRIRVNKVIGNINFSPGRSFQSSARNIYELVPYLRNDGNRHDFSHTIHGFEFLGDDEYNLQKSEISKVMKKKLGINMSPLDDSSARTIKAQYMFQYFLKVVSTEFRMLDGKVIKTHQFSVTEFDRDLTVGSGDQDHGIQVQHGVMGLPGAFFNFEISPILVVHSEWRQSFAHFLTSTCAIVGGVLTIASLLDGVLFAAEKSLKKGGSSIGGKLM